MPVMLTPFVMKTLEKTIFASQSLHTTCFVYIFFFIKGVRPSVWQTTDISIGGKNPTDINFATIGSQVKFMIP